MKIPLHKNGGTSSYKYHDSSPRHHDSSSRHHDNRSTAYTYHENEYHNDVTSPTYHSEMRDKNNLMLDMAVSADKAPFLLASKANNNLQRALNQFLVFHEREKKFVTRQIEQEQRYYRKRVAKSATAKKSRSPFKFNTIVEENNEEDQDQGQWAITKKQNLGLHTAFLQRPKTAPGKPTRKMNPGLHQPDNLDTMQMTYTFNSLFGEVEKHVLSPRSNESEAPTHSTDEDVDPLSRALQLPPDIIIKKMSEAKTKQNEGENKEEEADDEEGEEEEESRDSVSILTPRSDKTFRRLASLEAFSEIERKRSSSMSDESDVSRQCSSAPSTPCVINYGENRAEYVCENVFGNLSLEMNKNNKINKIQMPMSIRHNGSDGSDNPRYRRPSVTDSLSAYRQAENVLGRSKKYEIRRESVCSRRSSISSNYSHSSNYTHSSNYSQHSNSTLTYSNMDRDHEPGMAVNKAINFLERLDKVSGKAGYNRISKCHEKMVETAVSNKSCTSRKTKCPS